MKRKYWFGLWFIAACGFLAYVVYKNSNEAQLLRKDGIVIMGEVVGFTHSGKSSYTLIYKYSVEGKAYRDKVPTKFFKCELTQKAGCVGNKFRVIFSESKPSISDIDLEKYNRFKGMHLYF